MLAGQHLLKAMAELMLYLFIPPFLYFLVVFVSVTG